jgi:hypothetical protein
MTALTRLDRATVAVALGLPCITSLVLMIWAPGVVAPTTYAVVASLLLATAAIAISSWKSAQGTSSMGQLLYETETEAPDRWRKRYDTASMRVPLTVIAVSLVTSAAIVIVWLI